MSSPARSGIALVICAPSGTGKTTLVRRLMETIPTFTFSVSCTTRPPREGEVDGKDYFFLSREEFIARRDARYFAEWAEVHGNFYGTPLENTQKLLAQGKDILFDIDVQGAAQIKKTLAEAFFVFILPPSKGELIARLKGRSTETPESLKKRITNAYAELKEASWFDVCIINDCLETAAQQLTAAAMTAGLAPSCQAGFVAGLMQQWEEEA